MYEALFAISSALIRAARRPFGFTISSHASSILAKMANNQPNLYVRVFLKLISSHLIIKIYEYACNRLCASRVLCAHILMMLSCVIRDCGGGYAMQSTPGIHTVSLSTLLPQFFFYWQFLRRVHTKRNIRGKPKINQIMLSLMKQQFLFPCLRLSTEIMFGYCHYFAGSQLISIYMRQVYIMLRSTAIPYVSSYGVFFFFGSPLASL